MSIIIICFLLCTAINGLIIDIIFSWGRELHGSITQSAKFDDLYTREMLYLNDGLE